jgi:cobalt/nickel transport system permease protein
MQLRHADIDECANAWRHRHAGEKLLLAGGMLLLTVVLPPFPTSLLVAVVMSFVSLFVARIPWRTLLRVMMLPAGFAIVSAATVMVSVSSTFKVEFSVHSRIQAAAILARALAAVCCLSFLMLTTPVEEIVLLLRRLGLPGAIAELMLAIHRFIRTGCFFWPDESGFRGTRRARAS